MRTARLPTIHVVVASTRSRYLGWVSQDPCPGDIHTHPSGIPTPKPWYTPLVYPLPMTYLINIPTPPGHTHPLDIPISTILEGTRDQAYPPRGPWTRHNHPKKGPKHTHPRGQTGTCENITFQQLMLWEVKIHRNG